MPGEAMGVLLAWMRWGGLTAVAIGLLTGLVMSSPKLRKATPDAMWQGGSGQPFLQCRVCSP